MKKLDELKKDLVYGDYNIIQQMTKVPRATINAIMKGVRNADTKQGEKIRIATEKLIASRKALLEDAAGDQLELPLAKDVA